ncbi:MAG: aminotransferase class V-fold PLP-dependent enzyme [Gemmatimonadetes bacterium]|nr:aminotransferase class V-fold PLP-dependent enzyme [Gemmatimonadota bacterium]NIQ60115.1 aminotransferase class V-fold PLP-dependent enzyme [Gemmatimonadota bacterium]NIU80327.1 aminotransferase class V-fold PLP-dependent enzyme [Gammaproteobacteria bacterium]NIX48686.1 aminotransferase class V-fold PLP-dependent enzyme [Gemmatimonadota bacterium]NIY13138.1 aminotransferase class V-fold PLP-dependent enzyme [Gemmatimonadota bacterium]
MEYRKWEKGGLRPDGQPGFDTPTGKFEIWSTVLEEYGYEPLPKYTEPTEGPLASPDLARDYPLVFNSGARPQTDFRSQHHGVPGLVKDNPEPAVQLHPDDAAARGIADGDRVEVRTPRGAVPFRAVVNPDITVGAVECAMGGGGPVGPKAWREWNVNELTDLGNRDEISGFPVYKALLCEVVRIDGSPDGFPASAAQGTPEDGPGASSDGPPVSSTAATVRPAATSTRSGVYLDNNATTPVADAVREAMLPYLGEAHGNPSSLHAAGRDARAAVEEARRRVAALIGAKPRRIVFTGGGSEADNLALKGIALRPGTDRRHVVTSAIEHPAVLRAAEYLERVGLRVTYLDVDADGRVHPETLREAIDDDTLLVSVMMANNEVGTLQPVAELCAIAHEAGALFHTDAVQAVGKVPVDVEDLGVDLLSLSAHKIYGPKGVGALYVRKGLRLEPLVHGGRQERSLRAGTENVPAIVGLGQAAQLARRAVDDGDRITELRDRLERGIRRLVPGARLNGPADGRLPNTLNLTLPGLRGESLVLALDQHGIALSSGSACKAGSPDPTHVLLAMGRSEEEAHCAVRFSLSHETAADDIDAALSALEQVLHELETTVRFLPCK